MRLFLMAILASLAHPAAATSPIAEVLCAPTSELNRKLAREFGTAPLAWGTRGPEQVMQVWAADNGDWTLVVSYTSGTSCIVAMGENWDSALPESPA